MELKREWIQWKVHSWDQTGGWVIPGASQGGRIGEPEALPGGQSWITVRSHGARLSPPHQHSLRSPGLSPGAPGNIPSERRLMDLSPQCHPAQPAPHTRRVICFHREQCPSASPSSQLRAGRAGHAGLRSCFLPQQMTLGQEREQPG